MQLTASHATAMSLRSRSATGWARWGFLSGVGDANVWLTDQVAALRWIAANATAFGGDPGRITLVGQSGGAFSIAALAQHPDTRGLFQRGILQSPPLGFDPPAAEDVIERTWSLARQLGHTDLWSRCTRNPGSG
jgi:carboxylesterase type B